MKYISKKSTIFVLGLIKRWHQILKFIVKMMVILRGGNLTPRGPNPNEKEFLVIPSMFGFAMLVSCKKQADRSH